MIFCCVRKAREVNNWMAKRRISPRLSPCDTQHHDTKDQEMTNSMQQGRGGW